MHVPGLHLSFEDAGIPWFPTTSPGVSWYLISKDADSESGSKAGRSSEPSLRPEGRLGTTSESELASRAIAGRAKASKDSSRGGATVLIRMDPGMGYPPHRHLGVEEVWVLAGGYRDAEGEYHQGEYVRYEAGTEHHPCALGDPKAPIGAENPACVLLAIARDGTELLDRS